MMKLTKGRGISMFATLGSMAAIGLVTAPPASASVHCALKDWTETSVRFACSGSDYDSAARLKWQCGSTAKSEIWSISTGSGSRTKSCGTARITNMSYQSLS